MPLHQVDGCGFENAFNNSRTNNASKQYGLASGFLPKFLLDGEVSKTQEELRENTELKSANGGVAFCETVTEKNLASFFLVLHQLKPDRL